MTCAVEVISGLEHFAFQVVDALACCPVEAPGHGEGMRLGSSGMLGGLTIRILQLCFLELSIPGSDNALWRLYGCTITEQTPNLKGAEPQNTQEDVTTSI